MVGVAVGDVHCRNVVERDAGEFELSENAVTAAGIDKERCVVAVEDEAGVETASNSGISCAKYGDFVHCDDG